MDVQWVIELIKRGPAEFAGSVVVLASVVWYLYHRTLDRLGDEEQRRQAALRNLERWYDDAGDRLFKG